MSVSIRGQWDEKWQPVVDAFAANFAEGEVGAAFALHYRDELVVDIWAGHYSNKLAGIEHRAWDEKTVVNIFSAGKGLLSLCILQLVAQGKLVLDEPIASIWPEFAQGGKHGVTLSDVLCHRGGLSAFHPPIGAEKIFDWDEMVKAVEMESPWWEPGAAQGYSPFLFGWILGEVVRRVSGAEVNDYFQENIAQPLGVSCYFGVPAQRLNDVADTGPLKRPTELSNCSAGADSIALGKLMKANPRGVTNRAFSNPITLMTATNSLQWRQAQIPAANGHADARALASVYGTLASSNRLLDNRTLPLCWHEQTFEYDQTLGLPLRFSHGFMLSQPQRTDCRYGRGERAFGHPGAGGCVGFADPDFSLGFGYVTHRMGQGLLIDERAVRLINATYHVLEENHG